MSTTTIYVLSLQRGRYYVGKSSNVMYRYQQHVNGYGSAWTKMYKPVSIEKTIKHASPFEEDKVTKEYMAKYGIDKVRGGSYVDVELSEFHRDAINMEIWGAKDLCKQCGRKGHFAKDCYAKTDTDGKKIVYESNASDASESDASDEYQYECDYCDRTFTTAFGCGVHEKSCKENKASNSRQVKLCYRCGRPGHYSHDCYARTHKKGYTLDSD
jgi:predicted GIY-YIG superfamily endonuclease